MSTHASMATRIREKLHTTLAPVSLEVIDDSAKHAGHAHVVSRSGKAAQAGENSLYRESGVGSLHGQEPH